jgi:hypothetical protein
MTKVQASNPPPHGPPLRGLRRGVYWGGRLLQGIGLLLILEVLLLFASLPSMEGVLAWVGTAAAMFYTGWACTAWAKKGGPSTDRGLQRDGRDYG